MTIEEAKSEYEDLENELARLEFSYIQEHGIASRDGYIPQCFDEIGNEKWRETVIRDFTSLHSEKMIKIDSLKKQIEESRPGDPNAA
jgi:hypothetical protein